MHSSYFHLVLEIVFRRRATVSRVAMLVFGIVLAATLLWSPVYQSTAKILIQDNRAQLLVSPTLPSAGSNQPAVMVNPVSEQDLNSELELLTSRRLIEQALEGLPQAPTVTHLPVVENWLRSIYALPGLGYRFLHDAPAPSERQNRAMQLSPDVSSWVVKRSNVIEVGFRGRDPRWCRVFLDRLLAAYMEDHARLSQDPQAERFFQQQAALLQHKLSFSEQRLRALQIQTGISSLPEQKSALLRELISTESRWRNVGADIAASRRRIDSLQVQLAANPEHLTRETKVVQNMALQSLKPQVLVLEAERAELLSRYRPESERIREIDAKLQAAKRILARENHTEIQESSMGVNPTWQAVTSELAQARVSFDTLQTTQQELARQTNTYRNDLKALATDGIAIEEATRQVDIDREAYLSYMRKSEEARAAGALNQSKIINVSIAEPPAVPLRPIYPNIPLNLIAGGLTALIMGLGAGWWEEHRDARLCSPAAIFAASGLKTVIALPEAF